MSKSYQHSDDEIIKAGGRVMATTVSVDEYFDALINQVREDYGGRRNGVCSIDDKKNRFNDTKIYF